MERAQLLRPFWGREATLFGDGIGGGKGAKKNKDAKALIAACKKDKGGSVEPNATDGDSPLDREGGLKAVLTSSGDVDRRKRVLGSVREKLLGV